MSQSRRRSVLEAVANVILGYALALATQLVVFRAIDLEVGLSETLFISAVFVVVSLIRSYVLRRLFTRWETQ